MEMLVVVVSAASSSVVAFAVTTPREEEEKDFVARRARRNVVDVESSCIQFRFRCIARAEDIVSVGAVKVRPVVELT